MWGGGRWGDGWCRWALVGSGGSAGVLVGERGLPCVSVDANRPRWVGEGRSTLRWWAPIPHMRPWHREPLARVGGGRWAVGPFCTGVSRKTGSPNSPVRAKFDAHQRQRGGQLDAPRQAGGRRRGLVSPDAADEGRAVRRSASAVSISAQHCTTSTHAHPASQVHKRHRNHIVAHLPSTRNILWGTSNGARRDLRVPMRTRPCRPNS